MRTLLVVEKLLIFAATLALAPMYLAGGFPNMPPRRAFREGHSAAQRMWKEVATWEVPPSPEGQARARSAAPARKARVRKDELWRWLGLTVGGTVLPFAVFDLAYWLVAGHGPTFQAVLGRGEMYIPASIMNAEAIWILSYVHLPGRSVWFPTFFAGCGLAGLGGAVAYGITAALDSAPHNRIKITSAALKFLANAATVLSASEFLLALLVGTGGVVLFMLVRREEGSAP